MHFKTAHFLSSKCHLGKNDGLAADLIRGLGASGEQVRERPWLDAGNWNRSRITLAAILPVPFLALPWTVGSDTEAQVEVRAGGLARPIPSAKGKGNFTGCFTSCGPGSYARDPGSSL